MTHVFIPVLGATLHSLSDDRGRPRVPERYAEEAAWGDFLPPSGPRELEVQLFLAVKGFALVGTEQSDGPLERIAEPVQLVPSERLGASAVSNVLGDHQQRREVV